MNRKLGVGVGLVLLVTTAVCVADVGSPAKVEALPDVPRAVRSAAAPRPRAAAQRTDALFTPVVRAQLAARGIQVYGGSNTEHGRTATIRSPSSNAVHREAYEASRPTPERTTVEQKWVVSDIPHPVAENNPVTVPQKFATQLEIRLPTVISFGDDEVSVFNGHMSYCSGTLVNPTAVLTAGHCVISWEQFGISTKTKKPKFGKVRAYSVAAFPRRNGADSPYGPLYVKKSFWEFSDWPGSDETDYPSDHDYAVMRLKSPPKDPLDVSAFRPIDSPDGMAIRIAHYPFGPKRGNQMYYSEGSIDTNLPFTNTYKHNAATEPGSSGAGVFDTMDDDLVGVVIAETKKPPPPFVRSRGQIRAGFPNRVLMLTPETTQTILGWILEPI